MSENLQQKRKSSVIVDRQQGGGISLVGTMLTHISSIPKYVRSISDIGIDFSNLSRKTLGVSRKDSENSENYYDSSIRSIDKDVPYFKQNYRNKVEQLNVFASYPEIEFILETVCNDVIVYDNSNKFCGIDSSKTGIKKEEVTNKIKTNFEKFYSVMGFADGVTAWAYAYQFMIEGYLLFEKVFDDPEDPKKITSIQELDPASVIPITIDMDVEKEDKDGKKSIIKKPTKIWKQITQVNGSVVERVIPDEAIIYIAYNRIPGNKQKFSYIERLIRPLNLKRTMENAKVGWTVMNSQFRLKTVLPVGNKTNAKARQAIEESTSEHKEDLTIDNNSGEVFIHGQKHINYGKNISVPSRQGQSPSIEVVSSNGPDLSRMESVKHFDRQLQTYSKVPASRFDRDGGSSRLTLFKADGIPFDELSYYKFVNRIRKEFSKMLVDMVYTQTILDFPELRADKKLKNNIHITYESNSLFEEARKQEVYNAKLKALQDDARLTETDGRTPLFSKKYLFVEKYQLMSKEEWDANQEEKRKERATDNAMLEKMLRIVKKKNNGDYQKLLENVNKPGSKKKPKE